MLQLILPVLLLLLLLLLLFSARSASLRSRRCWDEWGVGEAVFTSGPALMLQPNLPLLLLLFNW
jgi:hypothetical protein